MLYYNFKKLFSFRKIGFFRLVNENFLLIENQFFQARSKRYFTIGFEKFAM